MKITSFNFFVFVVISLIFYYVFPKKYQWCVLLLSSLMFFYLSCKQLILYMLISSLVAYLCGLIINKYNNEFKSKKENLSSEEKKELKKAIKKKEKRVLSITVIVIIGLLIYLKYINFVGEIINSIANSKLIPLVSITLPIGISYYSLMLVSYDVDVYRGLIQGENSYFKLLLFTCYFPHIIEGPFNTYKEFSSQVNTEHIFDYNLFVNNICYFLIGLVKKLVIADRFAFLSNEVFNNYSNYYGLSILLGMIAYTLCLYFDFSGCIDIVRAISRMFGIEMSKNFDKPFFSISVQEFWRRWHISFGNWLRNYVFYPASLSNFQKNITNKTKFNSNFINSLVQSILPLLCVWLTMGLWHGASWQYVAYGLYYFVIIFMGMFFEPLFVKFFEITRIKRDGKVWKTFQTIRTIVLIMLGLTLFRSNTITDFLDIINKLFSKCFDVSILLEKYCENLYIQDLSLAIIFAFIFILYEAFEDKFNIIIIKVINNKNYRCIFVTACIIFIILIGIYGTGYTEQPSVYAEF